MTKLLRYLPGASAAAVAYAALKLMGVVGITTGVLEFVLFIGVYLILAVAVDKGMKSYGTGPE